jgi:hypothetical protein
MLPRALFFACILAVIAGSVAAINRVVDPKNEFYSGDALTAALRSKCRIGDDVILSRSYPEFKRDLFRRQQVTAVVLSSDAQSRRGLNLGFPGFGPASLLDAMRFLAGATPQGKKLDVYIETAAEWFDPQARLRTYDTSLVSKARYLLSAWTLKASLDLMRHSRRLAFTGWQREPVGGSCVVDRGSPSPAWRADGTLAGEAPAAASVNGNEFAWHRLTALDAALAIAREHDWRVVGVSEPAPSWETYERELKALFAKHGYRWRIRRMRV